MLNWMAWTPITAAFFIFIGLLLVTMGMAEIVYPTHERKGFLPLKTTRGDRIFIGLLSSAYFHLMWLGLTTLPLWWATIFCILWLILLLRWA